VRESLATPRFEEDLVASLSVGLLLMGLRNKKSKSSTEKHQK